MFGGITNWIWEVFGGTTPPPTTNIYQVSLSIESRYAGTSNVNQAIAGQSSVVAEPDE